MRRPPLPLLAAALLAAGPLAGCSTFDPRPTYSGPDDYAYTLTVGCFCPYAGPIRITVDGGEVVDAEPADPDLVEPGWDLEPWIDQWAMTLEALGALVERAHREADHVEAVYDPTYGFPTNVSIDWYEDAVDDEVSYTVRDYTPR